MNESAIMSKIQLARKHYQEQSFELAKNLFEEIVSLLGDDAQNLPIMQIELGWTYYQLQEYSAAIEILDLAQTSDQLNLQQRFDSQRLIGFSYEMLNNLEKAQAAIESALQFDLPEAIKKYTIFEMGKLLFTGGHLMEAENYLLRADSLFTMDEISYKTALSYYLGFCAYFQKKFDKSRDYFEFIISKANDIKVKASGYFGLAHLHYHDKNHIAVIDLCEKILRLDPEFFDKETLGYFLAEAYSHLKQNEQLENVLEEMEKSYPEGRYATEYQKFHELLKNDSGKDSKK